MGAASWFRGGARARARAGACPGAAGGASGRRTLRAALGSTLAGASACAQRRAVLAILDNPAAHSEQPVVIVIKVVIIAKEIGLLGRRAERFPRCRVGRVLGQLEISRLEISRLEISRLAPQLGLVLRACFVTAHLVPLGARQGSARYSATGGCARYSATGGRARAQLGALALARRVTRRQEAAARRLAGGEAATARRLGYARSGLTKLTKGIFS